MTEEEKQLLLKDLCARLPYNVIVNKIFNGFEHGVYYLDLYKIAEIQDGDPVIIKPYLRPMSSMTEEEHESIKYRYSFYGDSILHISEMFTCGEVTDWLNEHHFDYRGLIEKGLALEAPEGMYND